MRSLLCAVAHRSEPVGSQVEAHRLWASGDGLPALPALLQDTYQALRSNLSDVIMGL